MCLENAVHLFNHHEGNFQAFLDLNNLRQIFPQKNKLLDDKKHLQKLSDLMITVPSIFTILHRYDESQYMID